MSTHEFTAADCQWADLHFSDLGEAREHLDGLIEARKSLESMRRLLAWVQSQGPHAPDADIDRIDRGIAELESQEQELAALVAKCSVNPLFD